MDLAALSVPELKSVLKGRKLTVGGNKADLSTRLEGALEQQPLTGAELSALLRQRGMPYSGNRTTLIQRLMGEEKAGKSGGIKQRNGSNGAPGTGGAKRKNDSDGGSRKKIKVEEGNDNMVKTKTPKTIQEKVYRIIDDSEDYLGLPSVKKLMISRFGGNEKSGKLVTKAINSLLAEGRLMKVGGKYCTGEESVAHVNATRDVMKRRFRSQCLDCPYCGYLGLVDQLTSRQRPGGCVR